MTNPFPSRINEILALVTAGRSIVPMMVTDDDRADSAVMSLIAQHMTQEDLVEIIAGLKPEIARVVIMNAHRISAIRVCLVHPEYLSLIRERHICDQIPDAFREFLGEAGDGTHRVDSEDDLKIMFARLRDFCPDMAALVLTFAPSGIALQECAD